ncbi:MAG: AlpA family phage regulatory protein [Pseudomonadota bacterium]
MSTNNSKLQHNAGFMRLSEILQLIPIGKTTWWTGVKSGRFPKSVKFGRNTFWRVEDINSFIESVGKGQ